MPKQDCVLQDWVMEMSWKMQSILFSSLRGPDQEYLVNIKQVSKWMRAVTQKNADPSKPCMNGIEKPELHKLFKELFHFVPEMPAVFELRHRDKRGGEDLYARTWESLSSEAWKRYVDAALYRFSKEAIHESTGIPEPHAI